MTPAADPLRVALCEVRAQVARGDLRLPPFAQGRPGELAIPSRDHLFIIPRSGSILRAIPRDDGRRIAVLDVLARIGAAVLAVVWLMTPVAFVRGEHLMTALLLGGGAALLFVAPILVSHIIASDPVPVDPDHPLAREAASALWAAVGAAVGEADRSRTPSALCAQAARRSTKGKPLPTERGGSPTKRATA